MAGGDDDAAVRIEIETAELPPSFLPGAQRRVSTGRPSGNGRRMGVLVAAVAIAALSVLAILLLRPDLGETAAGTQRIAATSTTMVSSTTTGDDASMVDDLETRVVPVANVTLSSGAADVDAVIPWTSSFIALGRGPSDLLRLYSSVDGSTWARLPTLVVDVEALPGSDLGARIFSALDQVDERTLVVTMVEFVDSDGQGRTSIATRLLSNDGVVWSPDPDFERITLGSVNSALPLVNTPELMVVGAYRGVIGNPLLQKMTLEYVTDERTAAGCWLDAWSAAEISSDAVVQLQPCDGGAPVTLLAEQLTDPAERDGIGQCMIQLSGRSGAPIDIYIGRAGDRSVRIYTEQGTVAALPVPTADGKIAVLEPGRSLDGAPACEPYDVFEAEAPTFPGVSLLEPGEGTQRIPSLGSLPATQLFGLPLSIAVSESEIFVPTASGVYAADRQRASWRQRAAPINRAGTVWISPSGRQLFTFGAGSMYVADAAVGEWEQVEPSQPIRPDRILYSDEERVFFGQGEDLVVVELPPVDG